MTTTLEKMALAIAAELQDAPVDMNTFSWADVNGWTRDMAFDCARAALQAIREPDEKMFSAADALSDGCSVFNPGPDAAFTAMIDAILNEKP